MSSSAASNIILRNSMMTIYIKRRPDGHVVKRALEWNPQGKRKRGRPQHTWRRTRMAELEGKHLTWNEAKGTAQNSRLGGAL